jgi:hypothetical protein
VPQYQTLDQLTEKCVVEDRRGQADDFAAAHFLVTEKISPELFPVNREKYREIGLSVVGRVASFLSPK